MNISTQPELFTSKPFKKSIKPADFILRPRNLEIKKVYQAIIIDLRYLLSRMTLEENRTYLITHYPRKPKRTEVINEFICVMCSLTLSIKNRNYIIELDTDIIINRIIGNYNYRNMLQIVHRATRFENTAYNIESCLSINEDKIDHFDYFKRRIKEGENPNTLIAIEQAILE